MLFAQGLVQVYLVHYGEMCALTSAADHFTIFRRRLKTNIIKFIQMTYELQQFLRYRLWTVNYLEDVLTSS